MWTVLSRKKVKFEYLWTDVILGFNSLWPNDHLTNPAMPKTYPTLPHLDAKMCTDVHVCKKWCIVGHGIGALWDWWDWSLAIDFRLLFSMEYLPNIGVDYFRYRLKNQRTPFPMDPNPRDIAWWIWSAWVLRWRLLHFVPGAGLATFKFRRVGVQGGLQSSFSLAHPAHTPIHFGHRQRPSRQAAPMGRIQERSTSKYKNMWHLTHWSL